MNKRFAVSAFLILSVLVTGCGQASILSDQTPDEQKIQEQLGALALSFQENKGQVNEVVKFLLKNGSSTIFFTPEEVVYNMVKSVEEAPKDPKAMRVGKPKVSSEAYVIRQSFLNADKSPEIFGENVLQGKVNYMVGNDRSKWLKGLSTFGSIRYEDLYKGIDLVYSGNGGRFSYLYEVGPGTDPQQIKVQFTGVDALQLDASGNLVLVNSFENMLVKKPTAYQMVDGKRVEVSAKYKILSEGDYTFTFGEFDESIPLMIEG
jgi:hypothetical protein